MHIRSSLAGALAAALLFTAACSGPSGDAGDAHNARLIDTASGADWPAFGRTYGEQHFSPLTQIDASNVGELGLAWSIDLESGNSVSGPLAVDGILFVTTGYSVVRAIDAQTGEILWTFDPKAAEAAGKKLRLGWGSRGLAWWNGKIYTGTQDGRLIAIDAKTGEELWSAMTVDKDDTRFISGPPRVFDGKVIIGHGGADNGNTRGYVTTYDAETGKQLWRFYTVPGQPGVDDDETTRIAADSWAGEWWKYGGGGNVWNAMTYDAEQDLILLGTGNGAPWNHRIRSNGEGDNLFVSSIVALDAKTGAYRWHYQTNPAEMWDYNASMDMELAELTIDGAVRKVVMTAPKNGFFYVIDRTNGKLISAEPFVKVTWASHIDLETGRPVENPDARYPDGKDFVMWPGPVGAHTWLPMAYSPQTKLVYLPAIEMATTYNDRGIETKNWQRRPGHVVDPGANADYLVKDAGPENGTSSLIAWDPVTQKPVWTVPTAGFWNGGVVATAGNLVFQGQAGGTFDAYAADSGERLWSFAAQAPVTAPPITYQAGGQQYITVLTGIGSTGSVMSQLQRQGGVDTRPNVQRILTFRLGGTAQLPETPPVVFTPISDPDFKPGPQRAESLELYGRSCLNCHGIKAESGGFAPDLRASGSLLSKESFLAIVRDGALAANGMPGYEEFSEEDLEGVRHYLRTLAHDARQSKR